MNDREHETLALRLAEILLRLNQGDSLGRQELADQFGVSERTIYRDLNRLANIVERRQDGRYQIVPTYRGKFSSSDLDFFARLAGVSDLFPPGERRNLASLLDTSNPAIFLVKGQQYEAVPHDGTLFYGLAAAIRGQVRCRIAYAGRERVVDPYRLVNNKGIWYLAATQDNELRAFALSRIDSFHATDEDFPSSAAIQRSIDEEDDVWFSGTHFEVVLKVASRAAYYFQRRKLVPRQEITDESDGELTIRATVSHSSQVLPIVRYWIPHVRLVEPAWLRDELIAELTGYASC
ncbi:WYL domain-containing protein [Bacillus sp. NP157]|nr:WYL domain-containing protein [Bacillus sp. NP157]